MKKLLFPVFLSFILFTSCDTKKSQESLKEMIAHFQDSEKMQDIKVHQYSIQLPAYMSENKKLNDVASLQYANVFKELYIIVIDERKNMIDSLFTDNVALEAYQDSTLFGTYSNLMLMDYTSKIENPTEKKVEDVVINGLHGKQLTVRGGFKTLEIYYNVTLIEGKEHFYQVYCWTMGKYKDKYKDIMSKMAASFKEV